MSAFNTDFVTTGPVGSDLANQIDVYIRQGDKAAINERIALEHYDLETGVADDVAAGGQGRHKAGYVGVLALDTAANILAITTAGVGAIGYATDTGVLYRNSSTGWEIIQYGTGTLYASDAEAAAGTEEEKAINPKQLQTYIWVPKYYEITGHSSEDITHTTTTATGIAAITYALDEFTGDTGFDISLANCMLIDVAIRAENDTGNLEELSLKATTDTLSEYSVCGGTTQQNEQNVSILGRYEVPLFGDDEDLTLSLLSTLSNTTGASFTYTIVGVIQREYTV